MSALRWILPAAIGTGLGVLLLWLLRPTWGICIDVVEGAPGGGCFSGQVDGPAILFTVLLVVELIALVVLALVLRIPRRREVLGVLSAVLAVTLVVGLVVTVSGVWTPPYPLP
jgi:hypothetical protein